MHDCIHLIFLATCLIFGVISETLGTDLMPMLGLAIPHKKFLIKGVILRSHGKQVNPTLYITMHFLYLNNYHLADRSRDN